MLHSCENGITDLLATKHLLRQAHRQP